jgi:glycosyltransferase involved in cell wall biosynthesis
VDGIIAITEGLKKRLVIESISENKILVAPDGVDLSMFEHLSKEKSRKKLKIPIDEKMICYTGHLYKWKGVYVLAEAMKYLGDRILYVIGGTEEDINKFSEFIKSNHIKNIVLKGYVKPSAVAEYIAASDVVVLPNTSDGVNKEFTSPLKLFEYMASKRSIVATDLPSIREILNEDNAVLVEPDDPEALAEGISRVFKYQRLASRLAEKAYEDVKDYTWEKRAERILGVMKELQ